MEAGEGMDFFLFLSVMRDCYVVNDYMIIMVRPVGPAERSYVIAIGSNE